jgi:cyclase
MSYVRIVASLLISNKKLIKGKNFKNFKNAGCPVTTITALDSQKVDEFFLIDIDSYNNKKDPDFELLKKIAEVSKTPITFGGGVKNLDMAKKIFLNGADKIFLNSVLFSNKGIVNEIALIYGSQAIVAGINIIHRNGGHFLLEDQSMKIDPIEYAKQLEDLGAGELKITYTDLEGSQKGIDNSYSKQINDKVKIPCIFEGGIGNLEHLYGFFDTGLKSIAIGTIIIFSDCNIIKIKSFLKNKKILVRL